MPDTQLFKPTVSSQARAPSANTASAKKPARPASGPSTRWSKSISEIKSAGPKVNSHNFRKSSPGKSRGMPSFKMNQGLLDKLDAMEQKFVEIVHDRRQEGRLELSELTAVENTWHQDRFYQDMTRFYVEH